MTGLPEGIITDHPHNPEQVGPFRSPYCLTCGERNRSHLSWGESVAAIIGGAPLDYVDPIRKIEED